MSSGTSNTSQLIPKIDVPVEAKIMFDVAIANYTISPMIEIESASVIDNIVEVQFDVNLEAFVGDFDLNGVFNDLTDLLGNMSDYAPDFVTGETPSAVSGILNTAKQAKDFSGGLGKFITLVETVTDLVPSELRSGVSKHANLLCSERGLFRLVIVGVFRKHYLQSCLTREYYIQH